MSIGGEIKVVLTLDDSGFTLKTQRAKEQSDALSAGLKGLQSTATGVEAPMQDLAKTMEGIASSLGDFAKTTKQADASVSPLGKSVTAAAEAISNLSSGLAQAASTAAQAQKSIQGVGDAAAPAARNTEAAAAAASTLAASYDKTVPALLRARTGLTDAGNAATKSAAELNTATASMAASGNKAVAALLQTPNAAMKAALANNQLAASAKNAAGAKNTQSAAATRATQSNAALTKAITSLETTIAKLSGTVIQLVKANNNLAVSTDKNTVATDALNRVTQANTSVTAAQSNAMSAAGRNMTTVRGQADALTDSLKGMAQMWAALKIENGLKASVGDAAEMQQQRTIVESLNLPGGQTQEFFDKAFDLAKTNQFLSQLDAVKSRMSAIASVGENNVGVIDATLQTAVRAANNLQSLGMAHGDMQSTIRNLYGVVETRQQVNDPEAAKRTFNLLQQVSTSTGGKVQIQDAETVLRQMGTGAARLSDDGLINLMAVVDQFKVAGGEGGGGAGVSRVGTAYKMFQQYALGKQMTDQAVQIFAGSGLLNTGAIDFGADPKQVRFQAKHAGLVDGDLAAEDPVKWLQKHYDELLSFTQKKQNQNKYYQGKDINDPQAQGVAIAKVLVGLGVTTTASQAMSTAMDPASANRINAQRETIKGSKNIDEVNDQLMKQYSGAVKEFKANLSDLGTMIGNSVLPMVTALIQGINDLFQWFKRVGTDNPMLVQLNTLAAAVGGVILAFSGFTKLTGLVGGVITTIRALAGVAEAPAALASATGAAATATTGALTGLLEGISLFVSTAGKLFMRAIPYVGWLLLAWDLTKLIGGLEVGGHKVEDWFQHWFDSLQGKAANFWRDLKQKFADIKNWKLFDDAPAADGAPGQSHFVSRTDRNAHGSTTGGQNQRGMADAKRVQAAEAARIAREAAFNDPTVDQREANRNASLAAQNTPKKAEPKHGGIELDDTDANKLAAGMTRPKREFEDPFVKFQEQIAAKLKVDQGDLGALLTRQPKGMEALRADALAEFTAKWQGGDFDKAHDPRNRQWKNADGSLDTSNAAVQATINQMAQLKQVEEQKKAIVFANERLASTENDLKEAMSNAAENGSAKQTREMTALERELARAEERLGTGTKAWKEWNARKNEALQNRAGADLLNFTSSFKSKDDQTLQSLLPFESQRKTAAFDTQASKDQAQYLLDMKALQANTDAAVSSATSPEQAAAERKRGLDLQLQAEQAFNQHLQVTAAERARLLRTPMDGLVETWNDTLKQMQDAEASWANSVIDAMMSFVKTGKANLGQLAENMALDVLKIKLQETFSQPLKTGLDALTGIINQKLFPNASTAAGNSIAGAAGDAGASAVSKALGGLAGNTDALKSSFSTLTTQGVQQTTQALGAQVTQLAMQGNVQGAATTSLGALANAAMVAAQALAQMAGGSSGGGAAGSLVSILGTAAGAYFGATGSTGSYFGGTGSVATGTDVSGGGSLFGTSAGTNLQGGYNYNSTSGADLFKFANGGIMTSAGALQLRKYANGGVADSPQLALYGEGSMTEAYVPLPDGRTIPVTLNGGSSTTTGGGSTASGAAPQVTVNVINQTGQQFNSQQQGQPRFDGRQMILDVVLTSAQQPGSFRDGMKSAMKT
jgi:hypothetical protein